ncbi:hypothetical protein L1987_38094 [Smallanthus sonchifolius]|uniref:Uncharacterized protein n=1 Tax=Smallanthus sonchifolius TaxID=185202 RepID=A0ACB9HJZ6_9ASTR|nr:hypothetical protein L1987_38094 [Smallanthus sonchifolius]
MPPSLDGIPLTSPGVKDPDNQIFPTIIKSACIPPEELVWRKVTCFDSIFVKSKLSDLARAYAAVTEAAAAAGD